MRKLTFAFALLLLSLPLAAQQSDLRVSAFVTGIDSAKRVDTDGAGISLEYRALERWSVELAVAEEQHQFLLPVPDPNLLASWIAQYERKSSHPVDLVARYHFVNSTHWEPFLGAGMRYVAGPTTTMSGKLDNRTSAEVTGGVYYNLSSRLALRVEAKRLLREEVSYDRAFKPSFGVSFRF